MISHLCEKMRTRKDMPCRAVHRPCVEASDVVNLFLAKHS